MLVPSALYMYNIYIICIYIHIFHTPSVFLYAKVWGLSPNMGGISIRVLKYWSAEASRRPHTLRQHRRPGGRS